jgi:large subunit ribosomal protein L17
MRHRISGRKFNRPTAQRKALFNGLARALLGYEQIVTTLPKAKDLRPYVEKMLTMGKQGTIAARRNLFAKLRDNGLVAKICGPLATRYANRNGGYTRIIKCGFRNGDAAPMAVIELLDRDLSAKTSSFSKKKTTGTPKNKTETAASDAVAAR